MLHFKPRDDDRQKVMMRARMRGAGPEREICILDVSSRGISAMASRPPARGEFVELLVGSHSLVGHVKWSGARRFGLSLRDPVSVFALLSGEAGAITLKQRETDRRRRQARRDDRTGIVQKLWLAFYVAVAITAALLFAKTAGEGLRPLQEARTALTADDGF